MSYYLQDGMLAEYLLFHFGDNVEQYPYPFEIDFAKNFHRRIVKTLEDKNLAGGGRALDLGCATGRIAFELSRNFDEVLGIDYTESFINAAEKLRVEGSIDFEYKQEGNLSGNTSFELPETVRPDKVRFETGDAMNLRSDIGTFDVAIMANLIDRLPDPKQMLESFHNLLNPGGVLFILSPYTWLEEFTPKENWLCPGNERLKEVLAPQFELVDELDLPFLIRETRRKFQCSVSNGTLWRRRK